MEINKVSTLKQYNLDNNKMSNSISKKINQITTKSLTISDLLDNLSLDTTKHNKLIATELLKNNLPLHPLLFKDITNFLNQTDDLTSSDLQTKIKIALLLKKLDLPLK